MDKGWIKGLPQSFSCAKINQFVKNQNYETSSRIDPRTRAGKNGSSRIGKDV
jgi:hypothetical protein